MNYGVKFFFRSITSDLGPVKPKGSIWIRKAQYKFCTRKRERLLRVSTQTLCLRVKPLKLKNSDSEFIHVVG